ncbi:DUF2785 domain-containing protein [Nocardioides sp. P5_C9_2]
MPTAYWRSVVQRGLEVPSDRPLDDLTADLTAMLGSPDPEQRDGIAYPTLATWVERGVYDDLLTGLGDGMAAGLTVGLGEQGTDSVFRRAFSVLVLAECLERGTDQHLLTPGQVLQWGDQIATWYLREKDTRGYVPTRGWAHAVAHGADAIGVLATSPHLASPELTVLLDVLADRLLAPDTGLLACGEPDRLAAATMKVLRRDVVDLAVVEPWVNRIAAAAAAMGSGEDRDPFLDTGNAQAFLRALYLQLSLAPNPPRVRPDLILVLVDSLRRTNPHHLGAAPPRVN